MSALSSKKHLKIVKKLYYEKLYTMKEIAENFGVSVDAVVYFMRHNKLPRRSLKESNKVAFDKKPLSFKLKKNLSLSEKELKAVGTVLYWGEGYKKVGRNTSVDFANSDAEMVSVFMSFLRKICGVDESRLRVLVYCYANQNISGLVDFWSELTQIQKAQFTKPYVRKDFRKEKINKMPHGLVHIRYADKKLLDTIVAWIEEYKKTHCVGGRAVKYSRL